MAPSSEGNIAAVVDYLSWQDLGNAGSTVAFTATVDGAPRSYVFTQGQDEGGDYLLIQLNGVLATGLTTSMSQFDQGFINVI